MTSTSSLPLRRFTSLELRRYGGEGRQPAYVAYKGKVYDVTGSRRWKDGLHEDTHWAGFDLTEFMPEAPHGDEVFAKFPLVGEMIDD